MDEGRGNYSVTLTQIVEEFKLQIMYAPENYGDRTISSSDLTRPGLQLAEFYDYFDNKRVMLIGRLEMTYLNTLQPEERVVRFEKLLASGIPVIIVTRGMGLPESFLKLAEQYEIPILRTQEETSNFMAALIAFLNVHLAPRITRHGVLVEVYGEGMLLLGESGVGKSETAIELVKRGHRLIADDAVELKKVSAKAIVGSAPEIIRHFIELRGIGVVDVRRIFGMGSVKLTEKVDIVINLEAWRDNKHYDRLGMDNEYTDILGIKIPSLTVPVKPGRNLAVILEVAAMNNRHKKMGFNAAQELTERINAHFEQNS
ncbi:MAG: HPr(Ser) kinase/phosphatase [Clostridia bacterium]|nr:HPr(Ser) kinase/phosphatase [Clostridia bacterium]